MLADQIKSRRDKVRPKPLVRVRSEVLPCSIGPSLQPGSLPTMNDFQDKLIEESQGVTGPLVKPMMGAGGIKWVQSSKRGDGGRWGPS